MNQGWIKLHRSLLSNAVALKPAYAWLWVTLLLKASHDTHSFIWNGEKVECKRGQVYTGRRELGKECGISPSTVENILTYLENEHQIGQQKYSKFRLITVLNYTKYQQNEPKNEPQSDHRVTTDGHIQEGKELKNEKATTAQEISKTLKCPNTDFLPHIDSLLAQYPNKDLLGVAMKCLVVPTFDSRWLKFVNMCGSEFEKKDVAPSKGIIF